MQTTPFFYDLIIIHTKRKKYNKKNCKIWKKNITKKEHPFGCSYNLILNYI